MPSATAENGRASAVEVALRAASLAVAGAASLCLLLYPYVLGRHLGPVEHSALPVLLLGSSAAFVYGLGYRPERRVFRILFGPLVAWLLMAVGFALLWSA